MTAAAHTSTVRQVNENQCNSCMPLGGVVAFKGIENAMVLVHGSQGCSTYMRLMNVEHYNEPVDIASSALNEKQTIHGGEANLKKALGNVRRVYAPKVIGILTTCLAETMGEDMDRILRDYQKENATAGTDFIQVPTPSYGGSHTEGFWAATTAIIAYYARRTDRHNRINVIVPHISPADIREIKRILNLMGIEYTLVPDYSMTLDRPYGGRYQKIPPGGTRTEDLARMPGAPCTIQFGATCTDEFSPGLWLQKEYGVPLTNLPLPVGVEAVDEFLRVLQALSAHEVPAILSTERGWLLDGMADAHKFNAEGRPAIYGEPELVYAMTRLCLENGAVPVVLATGSGNSRLSAVLELLPERPDTLPGVMEESDFATIEGAVLRAGANIAIGHSGGKFLTERHGIPVVRAGFPVHDRMGGQRLLIVGYAGTLAFLDRFTNTLLESKYASYRAQARKNMGITEGI